MNIDAKKIKFLVSEIRQSTEQIRTYASVPEKDFWNDKRNILSVQHLLLRAMEASANICAHVAAKKLQKGVESPAECFELLGQQKLISEEVSRSLQKMARFRNTLIHRYWDVDEKRVYQYAKHDLKDFDAFLEAISRIAVEES